MGCLVESGDVDVREIIAADVEIGKVGETFEVLPVEGGDKVDTEIEMLEPVQLCLVRLFIEVDLVGRVGIGREIQELGMGEILERIDGR